MKSKNQYKTIKHNELIMQLCRVLYKDVNGKAISWNYRNNIINNTNDQSLTYGEIMPQSFIQILLLIINHKDYQQDSNSLVFADLGCGTGKACLVAALSLLFTKVIGIEIVPELYSSAVAVHNYFKDICNDSHSKSSNSAGNFSNINNKSSNNNSNATINSNQDNIFNETINHIIIKQFNKLLLSESSNYTEDDGNTDINSNNDNINNNSGRLILRLDKLANKIVEEIGHKKFKKIIKQHKSFANYINKNGNGNYSLTEDKVYLCLNNSNILHNDICSSLDAGSIDDYRNSTTTTTNNNNNIIDKASKLLASYNISTCTVDFLLGSILDIDWWSDSDVVYLASLLFSDDMMSSVTSKVLLMKHNSWIITLKKLSMHSHCSNSDSYDNGSSNGDVIVSGNTFIYLRSESFFKMSWQMAKVFIYQLQRSNNNNSNNNSNNNNSNNNSNASNNNSNTDN